MKNKRKKVLKQFIAVLLSGTMITSVSAEEILYTAKEELSKFITEAEFTEVIPETEYTYIPGETTEYLPYSILNGDENETIENDENNLKGESVNLNTENAVTLAALSASDEWESMLFAQLGDEYLSPVKPGDGIRTSGFANGLIAEKTDLHLPGKHGLDLKIKRKYDSQEGKNVFYTTDSSVQPSYLRRYLYSFTDTNSNNTYYIGVETEDDLYEYLYYGCYLTSINENKIKTYTDHNNETYQYYLFEDIYQYKTEDVNAPIHLIYNEGVLRKWISVKIPDATRFTMNINKILTPSIKLGNGWNINLPEVSTYRYDYSMTKYSNYKLYERKYNGAFRDIEGRINTFNGTIKISDYNDGHSIYYATYTTYDNRFYTYTSYYTMQTIANSDIEYNFKIKDNKGYTYYFYCGNLLAKNIDMRIVAIENDYSDNIVYNYIDGKLCSISWV